MTLLPPSKYPLLELAKKTSNPRAVTQAINAGVINFLLEAWTAYAFTELKEKKMLDGMTQVGAFNLGRELIENIEEDYIAQDQASLDQDNEEYREQQE